MSTNEPPAGKPAILKDQQFVVEEGFGYRVCRTGAIWMNKLFFSALVLLGVYVLLATAGQVDASCPDGDGDCSVFVSPTATYLGAMAIVAFLLSLVFGGLGLLVGKRVLEMTPSQQEVGAGRQREASRDASGDVPRRDP